MQDWRLLIGQSVRWVGVKTGTTFVSSCVGLENSGGRLSDFVGCPLFVVAAFASFALRPQHKPSINHLDQHQREGSFLGFDEAQRNFGNIMEGLRRSSDRMDVEDMLADQVRLMGWNRQVGRR